MNERRDYRSAGVDLDAADTALDGIRASVSATYDDRVLAGLGAFGGLFDASGLPDRPVLIGSIDGVGTKTRVAAATDRWDAIGRDLVHHCLNDVLVQGGRPLFFLDYLASSRLEPATVVRVVQGVADACREARMPLLGGETAEMPGVYAEGELDVVGALVGVVDRRRLVDGVRIREGDRLLGLASGGLQTNGFSLARAVLEDAYADPMPDGRSVAEHLLAPHRSFLAAVTPLLDAELVHGMAHVTGGGLPGNLPRVLPDGLGAVVDGAWEEPAIFGRLRDAGRIEEQEMRRVFNLGVGFVLAVAPDDVARARELCPEALLDVGRVEAGAGVRWA
ncbi:MAG: phosphoribosylformylglycinamidine cyclo-ligase [Trueperaceae bacterium]